MQVEKIVVMNNGRKLFLLKGQRMAIPYKYRTGYHISDERDYSNPVFSYAEHEARKHYHFVVNDLITMAKRRPQRYPLRTFQTNEAIFNHVMLNNGIEREHFERMRAGPPDRINEPGIMVIWHWDGDESTDNWGTSIDGNHRLCLRYLQGARNMQYYCFTEQQTRFAQLDLDDELGLAMCAPYVKPPEGGNDGSS